VFASNNTFRSYSVPAAVLAISIEGVQKFSKVSVNIAAKTAVGIGPFSDTVFAVTLEDVPPQVRDLVHTVLNETAVMLVWFPPDIPNGILIEYQVIYYGYDPLKETQKEQQTVLDGPTLVSVPAKENNNNLTIVDLVPGLNYEIKLRGRTNAGYGANVTFYLTLPEVGVAAQSRLNPEERGGITVASIIVAAVVVIAIISGVSYWRCQHHGLRIPRRKCAKASPDQELQTTIQDRNATFDVQPADDDASQQHSDIDIDETKIDESQSED
jgi:hypothetical protein